MTLQISAVVTYNARCARSLRNVLLHSLQRKHTKPPSPGSVLLFALAPSSTTPPEILSDITSTLTQFFPEHVGCISAPLPTQFFNSSLWGSGAHSSSCSLAYALVNGVSFHSTIPGLAQAQVGRWHAARERQIKDTNQSNMEDLHMKIISDFSDHDDKVNWEDVWDHTENSVASLLNYGNSPCSDLLPDALKSLDPLATNNILYFSDKAPEGLASVLNGAFPQANKVSLIASSTPFITGHPVTLFRNGSIYSNGAVGIAFKSPPSTLEPVIELSFPPLVTLSSDLDVTGCEGNLILSLDSRNPTQLLLSAIQSQGLAPSHATWVDKEDEFYIGVLDSSKQPSQLYRILAGDPSRGTIALDAASAPREGSIVRLYHLPKAPIPEAGRYAPNMISSNISFFVAPDVAQAMAGFGSYVTNEEALAAAADYTVVSNAFLAASENGFTISRATQGFWKCVVPGGRLGLSWDL